ncbi:indolepyruvate ferredoxin oxidoreductase subunit alpha [Clostridiisalibacter paucivorans]|uniref:indolepyruvate ferredoxin oxidoreductase subunit alpha n=1 Tax=Clostridiisalibacter paucivorans TaxID=408753 RepID=UPI000A3E7197|nr:4Fe-4S binding protein [Clostridiisalibacter paucivorans]
MIVDNIIKININKDWCKGCGICVRFCPKNVLELKNGIVNIKDESACIKCKLCELRCPDYAIFLEKGDING